MFLETPLTFKQTAKSSPKKSKGRLRGLVEKMRTSIRKRMPKAVPLPLWLSIAIFALLCLIGLSVGATIATYTFFGIASLLGLAVIAQSNRYVNWFITKFRKPLDFLILGATIYATVMLGVTISAGLIIAGVGFTLVLSPLLWYYRNKELNK